VARQFLAWHVLSRVEILTLASGLLVMTAFLSRAGLDLRFRLLRALRGETKNQPITDQITKGPQSRPLSFLRSLVPAV
ncbi:MAG: hypothetical protein R3179_08370, partial [Sedimenticolaceae bacterium]|nr:hypothetical protein [Sedimenticolaceae bacterium]